MLTLLYYLIATYMADHQDRHTCGKCGFMYYRLSAEGKRLAIPKNNSKKAGEAVKPEKAAAKKKKKGK